MGDREIPKSRRLVGRGTVSHVKGKRKKKEIYITKQKQGHKKKHVKKKKERLSAVVDRCAVI